MDLTSHLSHITACAISDAMYYATASVLSLAISLSFVVGGDAKMSCAKTPLTIIMGKCHTRNEGEQLDETGLLKTKTKK